AVTAPDRVAQAPPADASTISKSIPIPREHPKLAQKKVAPARPMNAKKSTLTETNVASADPTLRQSPLTKQDTRSVSDRFYELIKAADENDPYDEAQVGEYYERGWVVEQDTETAILYYKRAVAHGDKDACARLGWIYESGGPK